MPEGEWLEHDESKEIREWKAWRVRFRVAWPLLAGLWHVPEDVLDLIDEGQIAYVDENGVFADGGGGAECL